MNVPHIFIVLKMPGNCYWKFMWFLESGRQRKCLKQLRSVCRTKIQRFNSLLWRYVPSGLNLDTSSIEIWYISGNAVSAEQLVVLEWTNSNNLPKAMYLMQKPWSLSDNYIQIVINFMLLTSGKMKGSLSFISLIAMI